MSSNLPLFEHSPYDGQRNPVRICPRCGAAGKMIDSVTVKALVAVSLIEVQPTPYYFCAQASCPVVYYSADSIFTIEQIRERVYQKEPDSEDVLVCYCFRYKVGSIRRDVAESGHSSIYETISAATKAGSCACDLRNPQGTCCLGNVQMIIKATERRP